MTKRTYTISMADELIELLDEMSKNEDCTRDEVIRRSVGVMYRALSDPMFLYNAVSEKQPDILSDCKAALGKHYIKVREGGGPEDVHASVILSIVRLVSKVEEK